MRPFTHAGASATLAQAIERLNRRVRALETGSHSARDRLTEAGGAAAWADLPLENGWVTEPDDPAQYAKVGGLVYVRGWVKLRVPAQAGDPTPPSSGTWFVQAASLPVGFFPNARHHFVYDVLHPIGGEWDGAFYGPVKVRIQGGAIYLSGPSQGWGGNTNARVSLSGVAPFSPAP
jgi:hypothetical protein